MIFTGRLLASGDDVSFWQENRADGVALHFGSRGLVVNLSLDELAALARVSTAAQAAVQTPEDAKDLLRRLQILQARVTDYLRRERASHEGNSASEK